MKTTLRHLDNTERGQVLILTAASMIVLIGIAAIVVDLGFSWMLHRQEQNAADTAVLAAGRYLDPDTGFISDWPMAHSAACFYARQSGFFPDATTNDMSSTGCVPANDPPSNGIYHSGVLEVHNPPISGDQAGQPGYVQVTITRQKDNFFARLIGQSKSSVVASAVAANNSGVANPYSLVALDPETCQSGKVSGGGSVQITNTSGEPGGFVQVNSDCGGIPDDICSTSGVGGLKLDGGGTLTAPQINVVGECTKSGTLTGTLNEGALYVADPLKDLPPPPIDITDTTTYGDCEDGSITNPTTSSGCTFNGSGTVTLHPGVYYGGWDIRNSVHLELTPGIYIIAGGGIKQTGGTIQSVTDETGTSAPAVFIFSTDNPKYEATCPAGPNVRCQGPISLTASADLKLAGLPQDATCPDYSGSSRCPWAGMLLWQDGDGSDPDAPVSIGGQTTLQLSGTIYAPGALVTLTGGSVAGGSVATVQIISWDWDIKGGPTLVMPYDPDSLLKIDNKGLVE